jgi:hypothetical protein
MDGLMRACLSFLLLFLLTIMKGGVFFFLPPSLLDGEGVGRLTDGLIDWMDHYTGRAPFTAAHCFAYYFSACCIVRGFRSFSLAEKGQTKKREAGRQAGAILAFLSVLFQCP